MCWRTTKSTTEQKEAMELTRVTSGMNIINRRTQETKNKGKKEREIKVEEVKWYENNQRSL